MAAACDVVFVSFILDRKIEVDYTYALRPARLFLYHYYGLRDRTTFQAAGSFNGKWFGKNISKK